MNQHDQMREVVQDSLMESAKAVGAQIVQMVIDGKGTLGEQVIIFSVAQLNDLAEAIKQAIAAEQAPAVAVNEQFFNDLEVVAYENHLTGHIMEKMHHQRSSSAYGSYNVPLVRLRDIKAAIAEAVKKGVCDGLR